MPYQELDFPFSGGVDEKTQSQLVEPGSALSVSNLLQLKNGSYQKKHGNAAIDISLFNGAPIPAGKRLISYKDELIETDGVNLYSRVPDVSVSSVTVGAWRKAEGYAPQLSTFDTPIVSMQLKAYAYDAVYVNGYIAIAYVLPEFSADLPQNTTYGLFVALIDASNGSFAVQPQFISTGSRFCRLRMVMAGTTAILVFSRGNSGADIYATRIITTDRTTLNTGWFPTSTLATDANIVANEPNTFDACSNGNDIFAIAYTNNKNPTASTTTITVKTFADNMVQQATTDIIGGFSGGGGLSPSAVAIAGDDNDIIFVAYGHNDGATIGVTGLDPGTLAVTGIAAPVVVTSGTKIRNLGIAITGTSQGVLTSNIDDLKSFYVRQFSNVAGTVVPSGAFPIKTFAIRGYSRPFVVGGRIYCAVATQVHSTDPDPHQVLLVDLTASIADRDTASSTGYLRPVANILPRLVGIEPLENSNPIPVNLVVPSATKVYLPIPSLKNATSSSLDLVTLDWAATNVSQPGILGEDVILGGSPPSYYDGLRVAEVGFFQRPNILSNTNIAGALNGTYRYVAVYEQIDNKGQWHQSNVSDVYLCSPQPTAGQAVQLVIQTLTVTNRTKYLTAQESVVNPVRVVLYRTSTTGTTFKRVTGSERINNPSNATMVLTDNLPDDDLGAFLYTQPGLPNTAQVKITPPGFSSMITHGNRIVGADGNTVWFSGETVFGEGVWFADAFQIPVETGGPITALASLDGSLVVFKRDRIAFIDGQGPPDNGAGSDFSPPQFIAADVGCIEPRSVVVTPAGVLFQSLRGIEMLSRSRSLATYFGSHVEATLQANPVITSAVLDEAKGNVTFTCLPTESSSTGVVIMWDYVHGIWTTGTPVGGVAIRSAIMWGQQPGTLPIRTWMTPAGTIYQETGYLDAGLYVSSSVQTPWIKMAGLQGYGRTSAVAVLASLNTPCDVRVQIELDYESGTIVQTRTFLASELAAVNVPPQMYVTFKVQKCEAVRVTLTDLTPTGASVGTGQGATFIGLRFEYQQKERINRLRSAAS